MVVRRGPRKDGFQELYADLPVRSVFGELYQLGPHRLLCGDARNAAHVGQLMQGELADAVFTDPPYNVGYVGKTKRALTIANDFMPSGDFHAFLLESFTSLFNASRAGTAIYICHSDRETINFRWSAEAAGWSIKQCLIWAKQHFVIGRSDYHWKHEPILYGWKPGAPHRWYSDRKQTTIWHFDRPLRNLQHPTIKPLQLVKYALSNSATAGQLVIDFFAGSGSTLIAAEHLGMRAYVMEVAPRYCDLIRQRYADLTKRPELAP